MLPEVILLKTVLAVRRKQARCILSELIIEKGWQGDSSVINTNRNTEWLCRVYTIWNFASWETIEQFNLADGTKCYC